MIVISPNPDHFPFNEIIIRKTSNTQFTYIQRWKKKNTKHILIIIIIFRLGDNLYKNYFIITSSNDTQLTNEDSESQTGYKTCLRITSHYVRAQGFDSTAASFESPRSKSRCCAER